MKYLIHLLILLIPILGISQNYAPKEYYLVDSLDLDALTETDRQLVDNCLKVYHKAKHDTSKINALSDICENMMHEDWTKYQYHQYSLIEKALRVNTSKKVLASLKKSLAVSLDNIGSIHMYQGHLKKALGYYTNSLKIQEEVGNKEKIALSLNNIGGVYFNQGQIKKSLEFYGRSLKISEEIGYKEGIGFALNNIGSIYIEQVQYKEALDYIFKCLKIQEEVGNKEKIAHTLNNIGTVYKDQGQYKEALDYFSKALKISEEIKSKSGIANCLSNMGSIYKSQGQYKEALEYCTNCLKIDEEVGNKKGVIMTLNSIGVIYNNIGQINKAKHYFTRSLALAEELGSPVLIRNASNNLGGIYEKQNNYKDALKMHKLHITMRDSINNEVTQKATIRQQAKYEYEKQKAIDDAEYEKQLAIEQEAKEKQQVITYATTGGLGLVGIFLFFVFNRLQVTKRQKNIIEEQKQEVEQQKIVVETAHHELAEKNQEILDSINYAKRIQSAILPPNKVVKEYLQKSFILYKPKDIVAGDFYWMEQKDDKILFAAADCTGHGVPGAMVSVICNNGLNRSVREYGLTDPGEILDKTREIVIQEFEKSEEEVKDGMDIALCSLKYKVESKKLPNTQNPTLKTVATLQYAGAHNPLWIIRSKEAEDSNQHLKEYISLTTDNCLLYEIKADKQPIGKTDNPQPYTTHKVELQKGDTIYIFSDGYADQFGGEKGKKFKAANFKQMLLSLQNKSMQHQKEQINEAFEKWKGDLEQLDDVCIIGVKI